MEFCHGAPVAARHDCRYCVSDVSGVEGMMLPMICADSLLQLTDFF